MKADKTYKLVSGVAGLCSMFLLTQLPNEQLVHANAQRPVKQKMVDQTISQQRVATKVRLTTQKQQVAAASTVADAAFQLTNGHANQSETARNHSMGSILNDHALAAMTDETGSTASIHVLRMPAGLDENTAASWLKIAKQQAAKDSVATGRSQQIIMVAATAQTALAFPIGNSAVPRVDAVDVSSYQSWMKQAQYSKLKALGVKSVIIKISEGSTYANPYAADQVKYAKAAGLNVAVYHFARFTSLTTATAEAAKTAQTLKKLGLPNSTLIFADMEATETNSSSVATNLTQYWKTLNANGYTNHGVYTGGLFGPSYATATSGTVGNANTWYAQYPDTPSKNNLLNTKYGAWQFASTAYLPDFASNPIDVSIDYSGLFSRAYDTILSNKAISGVMQINQTNRKDGVYVSGPYNTNSATTSVNTNGVKYNGQIIQLLRQAKTTHSTYDQVMTTTGEKFWIDVHAVTTPVPDPILSSTSQNYYAVINQHNRKDGVYVNGPYRTTANTYWPNTDGPKYDQQFVHVIKTERTKWSTYAQVVQSNGKTFWIDIHALAQPIYYPVLKQQSVSYDVQVDESLHKNGVVDGIYASGPYRTSAATYEINTDSKRYDGQYGHVDKEATNAHSTYANVKLNNGTAFWIDIHGLRKLTYYPSLSDKHVSYDAQVDESLHKNGVVDGVYADGPYRSSLSTYGINTDSKKYDKQAGHVDREIRNANSTYAHITLVNGKAFWIDIHGLRKLTYYPSLSNKQVSYDAQIDESLHKNGVVDGVYGDGPYRSSLSTSTINTDSKLYDMQCGHIDREIKNVNSTYAHITLESGKAFWIDIHGLKVVKYDSVLASRNVNYDVQIDETHRKNGIVDGVYVSGPYHTSLKTSKINQDGKLYDQQIGHVDHEETTANSSYMHITLLNGLSFWIDHNAVKKLTYYPVISKRNVSYEATINEPRHTTGVVDGIYQDGPYRTSLQTYTINTDSQRYDGQSGHVDQEATNSNSTYAHLTLNSGVSFWIDIHGLKKK